MPDALKVKTCNCAAHGPDECVCGAWDDAQRSTEAILRAVQKACTCPLAAHYAGKPCPACRVWAILYPPKGRNG